MYSQSSFLCFRCLLGGHKNWRNGRARRAIDTPSVRHWTTVGVYKERTAPSTQGRHQKRMSTTTEVFSSFNLLLSQDFIRPHWPAKPSHQNVLQDHQVHRTPADHAIRCADRSCHTHGTPSPDTTTSSSSCQVLLLPGIWDPRTMLESIDTIAGRDQGPAVHERTRFPIDTCRPLKP